MSFHCTSEKLGDAIVVTPFGEVDRDTAPQLRTVLGNAIAQAGSGAVDVDLRHVTFLDSSGVGALLAAHRLAEPVGATLRVHNPSPSVRTVLEITNVWRLLSS